MKTKHEKIVEIINPQLSIKSTKSAYRIASEILEQLEPEGDGDLVKMLSRDISILKEGGYNLARAATNVVENYDVLHRLSLAIAEWHGSVADQGGRGTPPQQPSEGEISDIFLNNTVDYYGTAYMIFDGFKAAIKELNR